MNDKTQITIKPYAGDGPGYGPPVSPGFHDGVPFPRGVGQFVQFEPGGGLYSLQDGQWVRAPAAPAEGQP